MSEILRDHTLEYNLETSKIKNDYISFYNTD